MPAYPGDSADRISAELGSVTPGNSVPEIARRMLDLFTSGSIEAGTRLPPERQLSASLGVGRSAVRETLAALEILGIVEIRPGSGTYLRGSASELLPETLNWGLMLSAERTHELIELRGELEVSAASLAAVRATDENIRELEFRLDDMRDGLDDLGKFITADVAFHIAIAEIAGNSVLTGLLQSVRSMLRLWVERGLRDRGQAEQALSEHADIVAAIATKDPRAATESMRSHMDTAGRRIASEPF